MTGVLPVVRVGTELPDSAGRCTDEADVGVDLLGEHEVLVPIVEGTDLDLRAWVILEEVVTDTLASYRAKEGGREVLHARALTHLLELCLHEVRDVLDLVDEGHDDALSWEFFGEALRPEAVLKVVVLDTAELLDRVIAAVVVRQDEPLRRDDLTRTATVEANDSILERGAVGVVEIILLHREPALDELRVLLGELLQEPHTLVGTCDGADAEGDEERK